LGNLKGRDHSEYLGLDVKIILKCILGKYGGGLWTGCIWLRIGTNEVPFEHGNKPLDSINAGNFLTS
jgi:hypothetical protein